MGDVTDLPLQAIANLKSDGQRYVRVTNISDRGFVDFQFSVADPNLYLEMTLPQAAFEEFCTTQNAKNLTPEQARAVDETERKWRYGAEPESELDAGQ